MAPVAVTAPCRLLRWCSPQRRIPPPGNYEIMTHFYLICDGKQKSVRRDHVEELRKPAGVRFPTRHVQIPFQKSRNAMLSLVLIGNS